MLGQKVKGQGHKVTTSQRHTTSDDNLNSFRSLISDIIDLSKHDMKLSLNAAILLYISQRRSLLVPIIII